MTNKEIVMTRIDSEFEIYKQQELLKTPEDIFYNSGKNKFYITVKEYFEYIELEDDQYTMLLRDGENILKHLWDSFIDSEHFSTDSLDGTDEFVTNYVSWSKEFYDCENDDESTM